MKWLPLALALLTATPSHADEETKETGIGLVFRYWERS